ncbi:hypothetical protein PIB30_017168 [Stylosanthes scabra]|uniref:Phosphatidic acid phosphatase type 2/haloperoxidase domain-containing protein n=1 Tax=Stylosanthes scabra TaxID=79078 RepID=A0ABU6W7G3_9FABA|nr:hypothetical protein [Stylosanthes scabra]
MALLPTTTPISSHLFPPTFLRLRHTHPFTKHTSFPLNFSPSTSLLSAGAVTTTHFLARNQIGLSSNTMNESSTQLSAFRDEDRDDVKHVFEQEPFIDSSSTEFQLSILYRHIEPTINRWSKWIVGTFFGGSILLSCNVGEALWIVAGSIMNLFLSIFLKNILNQERPSALKSDPGMPSSHAQTMFFTAIFFIFSTVQLLGLNAYTVALSGLYLTCVSYFSYLRVSQQLHTVNQVVVGAAIGSTLSTLWCWLWSVSIQDAFLSSLWVKIIVSSGSIGLCVCFVVFLIRSWSKDG